MTQRRGASIFKFIQKKSYLRSCSTVKQYVCNQKSKNAKNHQALTTDPSLADLVDWKKDLTLISRNGEGICSHLLSN